mgnify:CR=1 FL=1
MTENIDYKQLEELKQKLEKQKEYIDIKNQIFKKKNIF